MVYIFCQLTLLKRKLIDVLYARIETKKGESLTSENIIQGDNDSITGSVLTAVWFWQPGFCLEAIGYEHSICFKRRNYHLKKITQYAAHMHQLTGYEILTDLTDYVLSDRVIG